MLFLKLLCVVILSASSVFAVSFEEVYSDEKRDAYEMKVFGNLALIEVEAQKILILDVSKPERPVNLSTLNTELQVPLVYTSTFTLWRDYLIVSWKNNTLNGVLLYDLANPRKPRFVKVIEFQGETVTSLHTLGDKVLVGRIDSSFSVWTFDTKLNRRVLGVIDLPKIDTHSLYPLDYIATESDTAYLGYGDRLVSVDTTTLKVLDTVDLHAGGVVASNFMTGLVVQSGVAYVPHYAALSVIDISEPEEMGVKKVIPVPQPGLKFYRFAIVHKYAFSKAVGNPGTLVIFDLTNPLDPVEVGRFSIPNFFRLASVGGFLYTSHYSDGFKVWKLAYIAEK